MKTAGLIGGMSWESTVPYYRTMNQVVRERLGGLHSAKCLIYSVDFAPVEQMQAAGDWGAAGDLLADAALRLEKAGAEFIIICTNTMHKCYDAVSGALSIPVLHIAELTADELALRGIGKVALLGTKYTMEQDFYKQKLIDRGFDVIVPGAGDREEINRIIFDELCLGIIKDSSRKYFTDVIGKLTDAGTEGVIFGCTEIGLLMDGVKGYVPFFDTAEIHARKAALYALGDS